MANPTDRRYMTQAQAAAADIDVGLRQYMLKVYNYMTGGLVLTGLVAFFVANNDALLHAIYFSPLRWVVMLAPIGFALLFEGVLGLSGREFPGVRDALPYLAVGLGAVLVVLSLFTGPRRREA